MWWEKLFSFLNTVANPGVILTILVLVFLFYLLKKGTSFVLIILLTFVLVPVTLRYAPAQWAGSGTIGAQRGTETYCENGGLTGEATCGGSNDRPYDNGFDYRSRDDGGTWDSSDAGGGAPTTKDAGGGVPTTNPIIEVRLGEWVKAVNQAGLTAPRPQELPQWGNSPTDWLPKNAVCRAIKDRARIYRTKPNHEWTISCSLAGQEASVTISGIAADNLGVKDGQVLYGTGNVPGVFQTISTPESDESDESELESEPAGREPPAATQTASPEADDSGGTCPETAVPGATCGGCYFSSMCDNIWVEEGSCTPCDPQ